MCGNGNPDQAPWQWNTGVNLCQSGANGSVELDGGMGYYSGAINGRMFGTEHVNQYGNQAPYCGHSCGVCYDLVTTGVNAYNPPVESGSTITIMIVDACYNQAGDPWWCNSLGDSKDKYGCNVHFDIQTHRNQEGISAKGKDGVEWTSKSAIRV